jgi:DNA-binding winged helix-turn-helix (wHTH) protein/Tol biopolymer transport system component
MKPDARPDHPRYAFGPFRIDVDARQLYRDGEPVPLTGKAFDTLLILVGRHGQIVEKDELLDQVWPDTHVTEDSLTQSISVLRRALGEDSTQPQYIATIPRRGYRFIAPVEAEGVDTGEAPAVTQAAGRGATVRPEPEETSPIRAPLARPAGTTWGWRSILVFGVPVAVLLMLLIRTDTPRAIPDERVIRFEHTATPGTTLASGGLLSPEGRHLAFVARGDEDGKARLWVRTLESGSVRALPGTEGAFRPFWSPDGQSVAFFADGRLKKVTLTGAAPQTLATVGYRPSGGSWSATGVLLYADRMSRIYAVSESGDGRVTSVTTLDPARQEVAHYAPQFLPDGRHFLFLVDSTAPEHSGTYVASLDDPAARNRLLDAGARSVTFAPPGHLVYVRENTLMAQPFDPSRLRISGIASSFGNGGETSADITISAAPGGLLAFGGSTTRHHLAWFDRTGRQVAVLPTTANMHNPVLSPDERQLLADSDGIWLIDLERGAPTRLVQGTLPAWAPGGDGVVFTSRRVAGAADLIVKSIAGSDAERLLVRSKEMKLSGDWSRDGRHFVYVASDPETRLDIWTLATDGEQEPSPFLQTPFNEMQPRLSPDGRSIAYASDETGSWEVYLQSFPTPGAKRAISVGGGAEPQWSKDGHELLYLRPDGTLMAVTMTPSDTVLQASRPVPLFRASIAGDITTFRNHFVVTSDGQRFLINTADESTRQPITVVVHWQELVR